MLQHSIFALLGTPASQLEAVIVERSAKYIDVHSGPRQGYTANSAPGMLSRVDGGAVHGALLRPLQHRPRSAQKRSASGARAQRTGARRGGGSDRWRKGDVHRGRGSTGSQKQFASIWIER